MSTDRPGQHRALDARDDMLAIAAAWPDLLERLFRQGAGGSDGMPKPPSIDETGIDLNEHVSRVHLEVGYWAQFLARVLMNEVVVTHTMTIPGDEDFAPHITTITLPWAPRSADTPRLLREIAQTRIGHFTAHPDEMMRRAFLDDASAMRRKIERAAYPDGYRTLTTRIPCEWFDTSDLGERVECKGKYTARPTQYGTMPDLVCSLDKAHKIPPAEWSRPGWRKGHVEDGAA